jgi:CheY-like chemotaxis protein
MANWSQAASPETEQKTYSFCDLSKVAREDLRVCIAEDNHINRKIAISFVNKLGLKCEAYEDGQQAYDALRAKSKEGNPFHLVLMDVQMPVLDGYEATKAIRADADPNVNKVLIIAMTASAIRGDREKCLEAGMNDYLAKPVRQTALKAMLDEYLNRGGQQANSPNDTSSETHQNGAPENGTKSPIEDTNGASPTSPVEKPKARRPFKRVMKKVESTIAEVSEENGKTNGTEIGDIAKPSPPSGVKAAEMGHISSEKVAPKAIPDLNGAYLHTNGVALSRETTITPLTLTEQPKDRDATD